MRNGPTDRTSQPGRDASGCRLHRPLSIQSAVSMPDLFPGRWMIALNRIIAGMRSVRITDGEAGGRGAGAGVGASGVSVLTISEPRAVGT